MATYAFTRDDMPTESQIQQMICSPSLKQHFFNRRNNLLKETIPGRKETQIKFNGRATSPEELAERLLV
jgi:hypothetical protein